MCWKTVEVHLRSKSTFQFSFKNTWKFYGRFSCFNYHSVSMVKGVWSLLTEFLFLVEQRVYDGFYLTTVNVLNAKNWLPEPPWKKSQNTPALKTLSSRCLILDSWEETADIPVTIIALWPVEHVNNIHTMRFFIGIFLKYSVKIIHVECVWYFQNNALWDTH